MKEKQAEKIYNNILKNEIYKLVGNKTTYLGKLEGVGKKLFSYKFKGVFPSDKIPKLNDLSPYCILNLDKSNESGSHWVALCKDIDDKYGNHRTVFYDSFGRSYNKIMNNLNFSGNGTIINTDKDSEQKISQTDCGARCLAFIIFFDRYGYKNSLLI